MGLTKAADEYAVTVLREWIRNHYQAREPYREMQREYMEKVYRTQGGCPSVMLPEEGVTPQYPHLWASLRCSKLSPGPDVDARTLYGGYPDNSRDQGEAGTPRRGFAYSPPAPRMGHAVWTDQGGQGPELGV